MAQKETLNAENIKLLQATLHTQLAEESNFYKVHYGKYYYDLLLMSVSMIGRATDRDSEVLENFRFLHKSLVETGNSNPKYLSFYGSGHLFNFGDMLLFGNSSPVKGSVFRIAIQYINCLGGWYWSKESYRDIGLSSIKKKNLSDFISYCKKQNWNVGLLTNTECLSFKKGRRPDAVLIFNNYGHKRMTSWKFD